jgi:methyltransferase-like protein
LKQVGDNILAKEQYLDFLKCRRFRQSLIVHDGVAINRNPSAEVVRDFFVTSMAKSQTSEMDLSSGVLGAFVGRGGATMQIDHALTKSAMLELHSEWPRPLTFAELVSAANRRLGHSSSEEDVAALSEVLLAAYGTGLVELHSFRPLWATQLSARPIASPLVRLQLRQGRDIVSTLRPGNLLLEEPSYRTLFELLDGSRDLLAIEAELRCQIGSGRLNQPPESQSKDLASWVNSALRKGLKEAILVA